MNLKQTPSQTVGPYFAYGLTPEQYLYNFKSLATNVLAEENTITLKGQVFDGEGQVIPDALVEIWDNTNNLFGRYGTGTDKNLGYNFTTKMPKKTNESAPFLSLILLMRGQLIQSYTRIYFEGEAENELDPILNSIPENRKHTVIAKNLGSHYQFNIYMQGENETVFFDI